MLNHTRANATTTQRRMTNHTQTRAQPHGECNHMGRMCTTANAQPHTGEWSTTHGRRIHHTRENTNNTRGMATTCMISKPTHNVNNDDEPHTGMIGITFSVSWYTFYDSPLISKKSKVAVWFWEHKKSPNLQSIVLYEEIFVGHWALRVAPEAPSPPILEKRAKVWDKISRKLPKQQVIRRPISGQTP